jgi:hypothetical protein
VRTTPSSRTSIASCSRSGWKGRWAVKVSRAPDDDALHLRHARELAQQRQQILAQRAGYTTVGQFQHGQ